MERPSINGELHHLGKLKDELSVSSEIINFCTVPAFVIYFSHIPTIICIFCNCSARSVLMHYVQMAFGLATTTVYSEICPRAFSSYVPGPASVSL